MNLKLWQTVWTPLKGICFKMSKFFNIRAPCCLWNFHLLFDNFAKQMFVMLLFRENIDFKRKTYLRIWCKFWGPFLALVLMILYRFLEIHLLVVQKVKTWFVFFPVFFHIFCLFFVKIAHARVCERALRLLMKCFQI